MIVVLGRLRAARSPDPDARVRFVPAGLAVEIARAGTGAGSRVELIGVVGDDPAAADVAHGLELAGVGHAALIRDPTAPTPGSARGDSSPAHLDRTDVERAMRGMSGVRAVVLVGPLDPAAEEAALDAACPRGIAVVAAVPVGVAVSARLGEAATVLEAPDDGAGPFARMLGRFAAEIDRGSEPGTAFEAATNAVGWQSRAARGARP